MMRKLKWINELTVTQMPRGWNGHRTAVVHESHPAEMNKPLPRDVSQVLCGNHYFI